MPLHGLSLRKLPCHMLPACNELLCMMTSGSLYSCDRATRWAPQLNAVSEDTSPVQDKPIMKAEAAAEEIAAAIMKQSPPREMVIGGKARIALLGGFVQKWVYPDFVERKFMRMFGLQGLKPSQPVDSSSTLH